MFLRGGGDTPMHTMEIPLFEFEKYPWGELGIPNLARMSVLKCY